MHRFSVAILTGLAFSALAQETERRPRLALVPFAFLSGDVSARASAKAVGMLSQEFKSAEKFELIETRKRDAEPSSEALAEARKLVDEAKEQRARKKFRLASESLTKALASYQKQAASVTDIGEVVDTYALLSAVQFNTGRDDEGQRSLVTALALAPERELPLAATSPLFARLVGDTRKGLKESAKGQVVVESTPTNAAVTLDGLSLGSTPFTVREVPPGLHYWRAALPNGEVQGGVVDVVGGKQVVVKAVSVSKDPESRLLAAVAQNKIDADAVAAAKEFATSTQAELLVFGGLAMKAGKGLTLDSFVYSSASNEVRRLSRTAFDAELLNAGMEFYNLAGEVAKKGSQTGDLVKIPSSVSFELVGQASKMGEAKYGVVPGKVAATEALETVDSKEPGKEDGPRKPLGPRAPLKKK